MSTLLKPLSVQAALTEKQIRIFTPEEFRRLFNVSYFQAKYFIETFTRNGLFVRLKRGLYALKSNFPDERTLANKLYEPSYLSFEYALSYYNMIPEAVYTITSATTKPTRNFNVLGKLFVYHTLKRQAFTGYTPEKIDDIVVFMADIDKTMVDYLYLVSLGKKNLNERLSIKGPNKTKVVSYAKLFERRGLLDLINRIMP